MPLDPCYYNNTKASGFLSPTYCRKTARYFSETIIPYKIFHESKVEGKLSDARDPLVMEKNKTWAISWNWGKNTSGQK